MATVIQSTPAGITAEWARDFRLNWRGYWIYGASQPGKWQLATPEDQRFGRHYDSYAEASAAVDLYVEADQQRDSSPWYVGCEWASDLLAEHVPEGGEMEVVFHNSAGPGSAYAQAQALYKQLCREPGGCGTCYWGRVDGYGTPEQEQADAEDTCERDPGQEEEDRQARYEQYIEDNHEALAWQDRYDAHRAEY